MDPPPVSAPSARTRVKPVYRRSRGGCATCKRRRKKCDEKFNEQGVCERCEIGGFACEASGSHSSKTTTASKPKAPPPAYSTPTTPKAAEHAPQVSEYTYPHPPSAYSMPLVAASASSAPSTSLSHFFSPPSPTSPRIPISSFPFGGLPHFPAFPYPSAAPSFPMPSSPTFNPFADLSQSAALLALFSNLPPTMTSNHLPSPTYTGGASSLPMVKAGATADLRAYVIRELAEGEGLEGEGLSQLAAAADLYTNPEDEWLAGFAPEARPLVQDVVFGLVAQHEAARAACLAVATLLRTKSLRAEDSLARAQIVETSRRYVAIAMKGLQGAPFEIQLWTILDLAIAAMEEDGPRAGYATLALGEELIVKQLGPRPPNFVEGASAQINYVLRTYAFIDCIVALTLDRRCIFDLSAPEPFPSFLLAEGVTIDSDSEFMRGIHPRLCVYMARICDLAADEREGVIAPRDLRIRAEALEREIIDWQPPMAPHVMGEVMGDESVKAFEGFATREMWREAILIHLRQALYHLGPLHPSIRASLKQIIFHGSQPGGSPPPASPSTSSSESSCFPGASERALPWWIAATCAVCEHDRAVIREGLNSKGLYLAGVNLPNAEKLWELTDAAGYPLDWRQTFANEGISIIIM